jgi:hypothetical protein
VTLTKTKLHPYMARLLSDLGAYMDLVNAREEITRDQAAAAILVTRDTVALSLAIDGWTDADIGQALGAIEHAFTGPALEMSEGTLTEEEAVARLKALGRLAWPRPGSAGGA